MNEVFFIERALMVKWQQWLPWVGVVLSVISAVVTVYYFLNNDAATGGAKAAPHAAQYVALTPCDTAACDDAHGTTATMRQVQSAFGFDPRDSVPPHTLAAMSSTPARVQCATKTGSCSVTYGPTSVANPTTTAGVTSMLLKERASQPTAAGVTHRYAVLNGEQLAQLPPSDVLAVAPLT